MNNLTKLLESAICGNLSSELPEEVQLMFSHYQNENFVGALQLANTFFVNEQDHSAKEFYLHFICVVLELKFDLKERRRWMNKWSVLIARVQSDFSLAAYRYHMAVSSYFESSYDEAGARFKTLTVSDSVPLRFQALAHYHLGLISRNRNQLRGAKASFQKALKIADKISHKKLKFRVQRQLSIIEKEIDCPILDLEIQELLRHRFYEEARRLYLSKRRLEIKRSLHRDRNNLHALLPVFAILRGKPDLAIDLLEFVSDESVKIEVLKVFEILGFEQFGLLHSVLTKSVSCDDICVTPLQKGSDIHKLKQTFVQLSLVTKKDICKQIWNLDYDPVLHDGKIYKLIFKFRNHFGIDDLVLNTYGEYQLNPRYQNGLG